MPRGTTDGEVILSLIVPNIGGYRKGKKKKAISKERKSSGRHRWKMDEQSYFVMLCPTWNWLFGGLIRAGG